MTGASTSASALRVEATTSLRRAKPWYREVVAPASYQSYDLLCANVRTLRRRHAVKWFLHPWRCGFPTFKIYSVWAGERCCLVAPFERVEGHLQIVGTALDFDECDILWGRVAISAVERQEAFDALLSTLRNEGVRTFTIGQLPEQSPTRWVLPKGSRTLATSRSVCIHLGMEGYEAYWTRLGKHTRQNVRTAYNRLARDKRGFDVVCYSREPFMESLRSYRGALALWRCHWLYCKRQNERYVALGLYGYIAKLLFNYTTLAAKSTDSFLAVLSIDGRPAAFMEGYLNPNRHAVEIPRLAIDNRFGWYSPGLLLINETAKRFCAEGGTYRAIDLCRGTEPYKLLMGGQITLTERITLSLEPAGESRLDA